MSDTGANNETVTGIAGTADPELLSFAADVLEKSGGVIEQEGERLLVLLPAHLAQALDVPEEVRLGDEKMPLLYGSPLLDRLIALATRDIPVVYGQIELPYLKKAGFDQLIETDLTWVNAAVRVSSRAEARATYMVLVCHYVALSDERKEGLVQVGIHEGSGAAVEGLEEQWKDFHPVYFPAGRVPPHFPVHLDQALSRAMIHAREATQRELADFFSSMERRLHRDVKNTREYYEALKSEMEASLAHPNLTDMQRRERTEKIRELPLEMERKIRDLEQKYQVQVNVTARAATRLLVDVVQLMVEVKHRKLRRQIRLIWNPVTYRMDPLVCERCGATITTIHLEEKGSEIELLCFPCSRKK
ncbi:hypothetical protein [Desulforhabdus amnigena]|uniref:Uncharacterized protein n=1 Tax=Desulforhabdus amnigena TaxID=40218 RepID=A0A9W6D0W4_9BACT|nr:hypothetical protein [Desulforhabdus amnigena]GLI34012.1 hypothetical protein DAMNIGENAA_14450 [Desulforhabdus amnigena]